MHRAEPLLYQRKLMRDYISTLTPLQHWERLQHIFSYDALQKREAHYYTAPSKAVILAHLIGVFRGAPKTVKCEVRFGKGQIRLLDYFGYILRLTEVEGAPFCCYTSMDMDLEDILPWNPFQTERLCFVGDPCFLGPQIVCGRGPITANGNLNSL